MHLFNLCVLKINLKSLAYFWSYAVHLYRYIYFFFQFQLFVSSQTWNYYEVSILSLIMIWGPTWIWNCKIDWATAELKWPRGMYECSYLVNSLVNWSGNRYWGKEKVTLGITVGNCMVLHQLMLSVPSTTQVAAVNHQLLTPVIIV